MYDQIKKLEELKGQLETLIEFGQLNAKLKKAQYDAFIKEGFTPEQALQLCKD